MSNPIQIPYNGKNADYYSVHFLKELREKDPEAFHALRDNGKVYFTVYHKESDFSEPDYIRRGCGLVNRMGFLLADPDFLNGDELDLGDDVYKQLRDILREAETLC